MLTPNDVIPIHTGDVAFSGSHPFAGQQGGIFAFAIRNSNGVVLFETGIGWGNAYIDKHYQPVHRPLLEVLGEHGVHKDDVQAIVNSHLHFDHCGGNPFFPGVPIHVQPEEVKAAHAPNYTALGWVDFPGARYEEHDGDYEVVDGFRVLATRGHTVGHQAVAITTSEGQIVLAGQAIYGPAECTYIERNGKLPPNDPAQNEPEMYLDSALRLIHMNPLEMHFSHDSAVWRRPSDRGEQTL